RGTGTAGQGPTPDHCGAGHLAGAVEGREGHAEVAAGGVPGPGPSSIDALAPDLPEQVAGSPIGADCRPAPGGSGDVADPSGEGTRDHTAEQIGDPAGRVQGGGEGTGSPSNSTDDLRYPPRGRQDEGHTGRSYRTSEGSRAGVSRASEGVERQRSEGPFGPGG